MTRFLVYGAGAVVPRLTAFLAVLLFSHLLSTSDFGLYALTVAVGEFCDMATATWYRVGFMRFYHPGRIEEAGGEIDLSAIVAGFFACTAAGVVLAWPAAMLLAPPRVFEFGLGCSVYVVAAGSAQLALSVFRGEGRAWAYLLLSMRSLAALAAGFAFILVAGRRYLVCVLVVFGGQAVIGLASLATLWWRRRGGEGTRSWLPQLVRYGWPLLLGSLLTAVMNTWDRSLIQLMLGSEVIALYAVAYTIGRQPVDMVCTGLNLATFTDMVKVYDTDGREAATRVVGRQIVLVLAISLPAAAGLALLAGPMAEALFDRRYWSAAPILVPPIAFAAVLLNLKNIAVDQVFYMVRRTGVQALTYVPLVATMVGGGVVLIHLFGMTGAAYALLLGGVVGFVISAVLADRLIPIRPPLRAVAGVVASTVVMATVVFLAKHVASRGLTGVLLLCLIGIATYALCLWVLDVLDCRTMVRSIVRRRFVGARIAKWLRRPLA